MMIILDQVVIVGNVYMEPLKFFNLWW